MGGFVLYAVEGAVLESEAPPALALRPCANAQREVDLCGPFTHALLSTFASDAEAQQQQAVKGLSDQRRPPIVLHYEPVVVLAAEEPPRCLRHVFFAKFKPGADVEALIAGYAALPEVIPEMELFEYGKLDPEASEGYEYIFMTTFENEAARDVYLAHPDHEAFAPKIFEGIDTGDVAGKKIVVFDF